MSSLSKNFGTNTIMIFENRPKFKTSCPSWCGTLSLNPEISLCISVDPPIVDLPNIFKSAAWSKNWPLIAEMEIELAKNMMIKDRVIWSTTLFHTKYGLQAIV